MLVHRFSKAIGKGEEKLSDFKDKIVKCNNALKYTYSEKISYY